MSEINNDLALDVFAHEIADLLAEARRQAARSVNAILTATYYEIGRRIVVFEQDGKARADYGDYVMERLSSELTRQFGRGFGRRNLFQMKSFYLAQAGRIVQTPSAQFDLAEIAKSFPLSWSHYVRLLTVKSEAARQFYEGEAVRGGWSLRQLDRQIATQVYERTQISGNKAALLRAESEASDAIADAVAAVKDPYVLEFLGLKDEYSEGELEEALIQHLESFLLELGADFTFVARQKRISVGTEWYRMDLLLFHRRLRCLVIIDLKIGKFSHADAGQMNLYVNYAAEHLTLPDENPPVGLVLCSEGDAAVAHYALGNLQNRILAAEYRLVLPETELLEEEIRRTRLALSARSAPPADM